MPNLAVADPGEIKPKYGETEGRQFPGHLDIDPTRAHTVENPWIQQNRADWYV